MYEDKILDYRNILEPVGECLINTELDITQLLIEENNDRCEINDLLSRVQTLANDLGTDLPKMQQLEIIEMHQLNRTLDSLLEVKLPDQKHPKFPPLAPEDVVVSSIAGLVAVAIDIFFVGTPEVVKISGGGERFDGSVITAAIRKLSDGPISAFGEKLSKICKVPYDVSAVKDGMYPQNHRLRSLSHDPFFGLFFANFDIIMGTTTFIDNSGNLRIIVSDKSPATTTKKILAIFYYLGHIVSDLFTARGIPIPGFFMTQFFKGNGSDLSVAKIAEDMYLDGYDMRHLASMNVPVLVKNIIIDAYLKLTKASNEIVSPVALKEKKQLDEKLRKEKMEFIANSITVGGNVVKFFAPPTSCNPCSLNAPEWFAFLRSSLIMIRATTRDTVIEEAIYNRKDIHDKWNKEFEVT